MRIEQEIECIPLMSLAMIGVEIDCACECLLCPGPFKAVHQGMSQRGMRLGQRVVNIQGL